MSGVRMAMMSASLTASAGSAVASRPRWRFPALAALADADDHVEAGVLQVLGMGPALRAIADDGDALAGDGAGADVVVGVDRDPWLRRPLGRIGLRISRALGRRRVGNGHGALRGRGHRGAVFGEDAVRRADRRQDEVRPARGQIGVHVDPAVGDVDGDAVAVADQTDRPADGRFRRDVAGDEAVAGAREAAVGDQGDVVDAAALQGGGDLQHLAHAGTALGAFVADDDDIAFADRAVLDGVEGVFLAVEDAGRALEPVGLVAGQLDDRAVRGDVAVDDGVGCRAP
jgi:hypothetical protein